MPYSERFGRLFKERMQPHDYDEVAGRLKMHPTTLYNYAKGQAPNEPSRIERVAAAIGLDERGTRELLDAAFGTGVDDLVEHLADAEEADSDRFAEALIRGIEKRPRLKDALRRAFPEA